jgi:hypothetical protein
LKPRLAAFDETENGGGVSRGDHRKGEFCLVLSLFVTVCHKPGFALEMWLTAGNR